MGWGGVGVRRVASERQGGRENEQTREEGGGVEAEVPLKIRTVGATPLRVKPSPRVLLGPVCI